MNMFFWVIHPLILLSGNTHRPLSINGDKIFERHQIYSKVFKKNGQVPGIEAIRWEKWDGHLPCSRYTALCQSNW